MHVCILYDVREDDDKKSRKILRERKRSVILGVEIKKKLNLKQV